MRLSLALATLGLLLAAAALYGYQTTTETTSGDVAAAESLLERSAPIETVATTVPSSTTSSTTAQPLWQPNQDSPSEISEQATPARLIVDKLDIDAPIGAYGVDSRGRMDVPDNITEVGWYRFGPAPGQPGSTVLAAHVDLAGPGRGLFFDLDDLAEGDRVAVEMSDGSILNFEVVAQTTYLKAELPLDTIFSRDGQPVLTLVTCGGDFSSSARSYDSNVVVYAVPAA